MRRPKKGGQVEGQGAERGRSKKATRNEEPSCEGSSEGRLLLLVLPDESRRARRRRTGGLPVLEAGLVGLAQLERVEGDALLGGPGARRLGPDLLGDLGVGERSGQEVLVREFLDGHVLDSRRCQDWQGYGSQGYETSTPELAEGEHRE